MLYCCAALCIQLFDFFCNIAVGSMEVSGDGVSTADGVACDVTTSCGGVSNGGGVTIRVAMGGGDTSTAKGRTEKSPVNNKKKAGKIYTINLNTGKTELWAQFS